MRIKTLLLASVFISFGFGTGSTKPIDFDQGWYQFFKKPIKRHLYSSNQVPINGSILVDKLREILLLENKDQLFMEAGTVDIPKSKHHNSADPLMESMPNEDNSREDARGGAGGAHASLKFQNLLNRKNGCH